MFLLRINSHNETFFKERVFPYLVGTPFENPILSGFGFKKCLGYRVELEYSDLLIAWLNSLYCSGVIYVQSDDGSRHTINANTFSPSTFDCSSVPTEMATLLKNLLLASEDVPDVASLCDCLSSL